MIEFAYYWCLYFESFILNKFMNAFISILDSFLYYFILFYEQNRNQ